MKRFSLIFVACLFIFSAQLMAAAKPIPSALHSPLPTPTKPAVMSTPAPEAAPKQSPTPQRAPLPRQPTQRLTQQQQRPVAQLDPSERAFYEGMLAMCAWRGEPCNEAVQQAKARDWYRHWRQE